MNMPISRRMKKCVAWIMAVVMLSGMTGNIPLTGKVASAAAAWDTWSSSTEGLNSWNSIGEYKSADDNRPFAGTFDGEGHTVSGLWTCTRTRTTNGLFGYSTGVIKNVNVEKSYIEGSGYGVGGIVNCYNQGNVTVSQNGGYCGTVAGALERAGFDSCGKVSYSYWKNDISPSEPVGYTGEVTFTEATCRKYSSDYTLYTVSDAETGVDFTIDVSSETADRLADALDKWTQAKNYGSKEVGIARWTSGSDGPVFASEAADTWNGNFEHLGTTGDSRYVTEAIDNTSMYYYYIVAYEDIELPSGLLKSAGVESETVTVEPGSVSEGQVTGLSGTIKNDTVSLTWDKVDGVSVCYNR